MDSGTASGGAFNAIPISLAAYDGRCEFQSGSSISITGTQNRIIDPFSTQTTIGRSGPSFDSLEKVSLGANGGACVADDLSFSSRLLSTAAILIEVDNFVICKANQLSGLLPSP